MISSEQILFLEQIAKALAVQFGPQCEVAVHDLTAGRDGTIVAIENGHVTGRDLGDGGGEAVQAALGGGKAPENTLCRLIRTSDGRLLKASTVCLRDASGAAAAMLSVHYDITAVSHASMILTQFLDTRRGDEDQDALPFANVSELLEQLIEESVQHVGKPVALMSKEDKIKAIHFLDDKGAFLIKKSGDKISKYYDISKYTLYNYMDSERKV